ncbi:IFI27 [Acrasis kona]|uniref:IFI27 n=1 Tax=Acrasis kona TaxID=1008807 RepID=A0AAW2Z2W4_9EUKA
MTDPVSNSEVGWRKVADSVKAGSYLVKDGALYVWNSAPKVDVETCKNISSKIAEDAWSYIPSKDSILQKIPTHSQFIEQATSIPKQAVAGATKLGAYCIHTIKDTTPSVLSSIQNSTQNAKDLCIYVYRTTPDTLSNAYYTSKNYASKLKNQEVERYKNSPYKYLYWVGGAACAVTVYYFVLPYALTGLGFTQDGIAKKSIGSYMMSKHGAYTTSGSLVSNLQSIGAKSAPYLTTFKLIKGGLASIGAYQFFKTDKDEENVSVGCHEPIIADKKVLDSIKTYGGWYHKKITEPVPSSI